MGANIKVFKPSPKAEFLEAVPSEDGFGSTRMVLHFAYIPVLSDCSNWSSGKYCLSLQTSPLQIMTMMPPRQFYSCFCKTQRPSLVDTFGNATILHRHWQSIRSTAATSKMPFLPTCSSPPPTVRERQNHQAEALSVSLS